MRRGPTPSGPFTTLTGRPQASFTLNNYLALPDQLNLSGLQSATRYRVYIAGSLTWNGMGTSRSGQIYYTAP